MAHGCFNLSVPHWLLLEEDISIIITFTGEAPFCAQRTDGRVNFSLGFKGRTAKHVQATEDGGCMKSGVDTVDVNDVHVVGVVCSGPFLFPLCVVAGMIMKSWWNYDALLNWSASVCAWWYSAFTKMKIVLCFIQKLNWSFGVANPNLMSTVRTGNNNDITVGMKINSTRLGLQLTDQPNNMHTKTSLYDQPLGC